MNLKSAGLATTLLVSSGLGLAAFGLGAGTANATGRPYCPSDPPNWAPGGPPSTSFVHWDWNVCHNYHYGPTGVVDEDTGFIWLYPTGPIAPAAPRTPSPPPPGCPPWATIFSGPAQCGGL
jgi:hypothetical protein